jgi:hypothetical protein
MSERERVEEQIRKVLENATQAIALSEMLFSPSGLFNQIAATEDERRVVAQSSLFRQAQRRLTELQQKEAAEFGRAVEQTRGAIPEGSYWLKLERSEKAREQAR